MGRNARQEYEMKYTPARNYEALMSIYGAAMSTQTMMGVPLCRSIS